MSEELYYIQDSRSYCGNSCFWWRVDGKGYTCDLRDAWKVTKEKAQRIIRNRPGVDKAWPCSLIDAGVTLQFDMQKLSDIEALNNKPYRRVK